MNRKSYFSLILCWKYAGSSDSFYIGQG